MSEKLDEQLKARESFRQKALASWAEYQETGRHLTGGEFQKWLRGWGAEGEGEMPDCHE